MGIHDCRECWFITDEHCDCELCGKCPLEDDEMEEEE